MNISVEAETGVGKSTFAFTAPKKLVNFNFDLGAEGAIYGYKYPELFQRFSIGIIPYEPSYLANYISTKCWSTSDITIIELPLPLHLHGELIKGRSELWDYFMKLFIAVCEDAEVRTIVLDTATQAKQVKVDAHIQLLQEQTIAHNLTQPKDKQEKIRQQLIEIEYGKPYGDMRAVYQYMTAIKKNLVALHQLKDKYETRINSKGQSEQMPSGEQVLDGATKTMELMDVGLRLSDKGKKVYGRVTKCRPNRNLEGDELENPTWNSVMDLLSMSLGGRVKMEKEL